MTNIRYCLTLNIQKLAKGQPQLNSAATTVKTNIQQGDFLWTNRFATTFPKCLSQHSISAGVSTWMTLLGFGRTYVKGFSGTRYVLDYCHPDRSLPDNVHCVFIKAYLPSKGMIE